MKAKFGTWSKDGETRTPETKDLVNWLIADGWKQDEEEESADDDASGSDAAPADVDPQVVQPEEQPPAPEAQTR